MSVLSENLAETGDEKQSTTVVVPSEPSVDNKSHTTSGKVYFGK